jgi:macrolide-specific efflux system membrane fusion protein
MLKRLNLRHPSTAVNAALALAIVGGAVWTYETVHGSGGSSAAGASAAQSSLVQQGTVTKTATATGTLASASTASADFTTSGIVTEIDAEVGQVVKKGQLLGKVDAAAAKRSLAAAKVDLDVAEDSLSAAEDAGSDTASAEAGVESAETAVTTAQEAVDGCTLTAPMAGTVTAVNGTIGSSSSGGGSSSTSTSSSTSSSASDASTSTSTSSSSGFMEIENVGKLEVTAAFAEADATALKAGQAATITWTALSDTAEPGKVTSIDPNATTSDSVVSYAVTLGLDATPAAARVGQSVSITVTTGTAENALYVDSAAITTVGTQHTVTVVSGSTRTTRVVKIGQVGDSTTQVTSGVQAGEEVVVKATTSTSTGGTTGSSGGGTLTGGTLGGGTGGPPN